MTQLVHTMSVSNNHALFYLWWKENLVKHQKVSKYYENDCSITPLNLSHTTNLNHTTFKNVMWLNLQWEIDESEGVHFTLGTRLPAGWVVFCGGRGKIKFYYRKFFPQVIKFCGGWGKIKFYYRKFFP